MKSYIIVFMDLTERSELALAADNLTRDAIPVCFLSRACGVISVHEISMAMP